MHWAGITKNGKWYSKSEQIISLFKLLLKIVWEQSVNRSQIGRQYKTYDIRTCEKYLFLNISSTNIDTLVPSLYHCFETYSTEVFWLLSQPLPYLRFNLFVISETFATQLWTALRDKHVPT
jgi:hypothetical protein